MVEELEEEEEVMEELEEEEEVMEELEEEEEVMVGVCALTKIYAMQVM